MEGKSSTLLITAFIALLIGVMLLASVSTEEQKKVTLTGVVNQNVTIVRLNIANDVNETMSTAQTSVTYSDTNDWRLQDRQCDFALTQATNGSTVLTLNTDVNVSATGNITIRNSSTMKESKPNSSLVSYKYCPSDYIAQSWQRTIMNMIPGFFAIALLIISVALFYEVARNEGFLNNL